MLATLLALMMLPGTGTTTTTTTAQGNVHMLEFPVLVAECNRDPGQMLQPGGGRFDPAEVMDDHECGPLEGVSVTVSNRDIDFFARCETDDDGMCHVEAPTDPERELMVALHMSTVPPGFAPANVVTPTVHFSEFTGVGIAVLPDASLDEDELEDLPPRRTLAIKAVSDGEPAEILTQLSEGDVAIGTFPWLATNDEGWVSYDLGLYDTPFVDLMLEVDADEAPDFSCSDLESREALETEWIDGFEGTFFRITLPKGSDGNINCDLSLAGS